MIAVKNITKKKIKDTPSEELKNLNLQLTKQTKKLIKHRKSYILKRKTIKNKLTQQSFIKTVSLFTLKSYIAQVKNSTSSALVKKTYKNSIVKKIKQYKEKLSNNPNVDISQVYSISTKNALAIALRSVVPNAFWRYKSIIKEDGIGNEKLQYFTKEINLLQNLREEAIKIAYSHIGTNAGINNAKTTHDKDMHFYIKFVHNLSNNQFKNLVDVIESNNNLEEVCAMQPITKLRTLDKESDLVFLTKEQFAKLQHPFLKHSKNNINIVDINGKVTDILKKGPTIFFQKGLRLEFHKQLAAVQSINKTFFDDNVSAKTKRAKFFHLINITDQHDNWEKYIKIPAEVRFFYNFIASQDSSFVKFSNSIAKIDNLIKRITGVRIKTNHALNNLLNKESKIYTDNKANLIPSQNNSTELTELLKKYGKNKKYKYSELQNKEDKSQPEHQNIVVKKIKEPLLKAKTQMYVITSDKKNIKNYKPLSIIKHTGNVKTHVNLSNNNVADKQLIYKLQKNNINVLGLVKKDQLQFKKTLKLPIVTYESTMYNHYNSTSVRATARGRNSEKGLIGKKVNKQIT